MLDKYRKMEECEKVQVYKGLDSSVRRHVYIYIYTYIL